VVTVGSKEGIELEDSPYLLETVGWVILDLDWVFSEDDINYLLILGC
jgi:hypothetical protein